MPKKVVPSVLQNPRKKKSLEALSEGQPQQDVLATSRINKSTWESWMLDPVFQQMAEEKAEEIFYEAELSLQLMVLKAVEVIKDCLNGQGTATQMKTAQDVLQRAGLDDVRLRKRTTIDIHDRRRLNTILRALPPDALIEALGDRVIDVEATDVTHGTTNSASSNSEGSSGQ